jgi:hypothetical protein
LPPSYVVLAVSPQPLADLASVALAALAQQQMVLPRAVNVLSRPANRLAPSKVQSFVSLVDRQTVALFQRVRRAFGGDVCKT